MVLKGNIQHSFWRRFFSDLLKVILLLVIIVAAFIIIANVYTVLTTRNDLHTVSDLEDAEVDAVIVLGASVYADGTPSDMLADRLDVAIDLYKAGAARKIVVTGDGRDSHYNEPDAMKAYCIGCGVPAGDILVDSAGYNTYASIYRAQSVFGLNDVIVVTQAYHLYRALAIAHGLGMQASGVAADKGEYEHQTLYSVREVGARATSLMRVLLHVQPDESLED